jgi:putative transposase
MASSEVGIDVFATLSFDSEAQIAFELNQAEDAAAVGEVYRKAGISEATFYNWHKRFAGLMSSEVKRLRQLEVENAKPKRLLAVLNLDKAVLQCHWFERIADTLKPARRRRLVDEVRENWKVSVRKLRHALRIDRLL